MRMTSSYDGGTHLPESSDFDRARIFQSAAEQQYCTMPQLDAKSLQALQQPNSQGINFYFVSTTFANSFLFNKNASDLSQLLHERIGDSAGAQPDRVEFLVLLYPQDGCRIELRVRGAGSLVDTRANGAQDLAANNLSTEILRTVAISKYHAQTTLDWQAELQTNLRITGFVVFGLLLILFSYVLWVQFGQPVWDSEQENKVLKRQLEDQIAEFEAAHSVFVARFAQLHDEEPFLKLQPRSELVIQFEAGLSIFGDYLMAGQTQIEATRQSLRKASKSELLLLINHWDDSFTITTNEGGASNSPLTTKTVLTREQYVDHLTRIDAATHTNHKHLMPNL